MKSNKIKLIIVDLYGVMTHGSYKDTCLWLANKYHMNFNRLYEVVYHKYFTPATLGKITERQAFIGPIKELQFKETWKQLRSKHLSFQKLNRPVFRLVREWQRKGYKILLLSKNTPYQFKYTVKKLGLRKHFRIINTYDLGLAKGSPKTIRAIIKKYKVLPTEVLMIDDQNFNLVSAKKLGVKTILYKNFKAFKLRITHLIE